LSENDGYLEYQQAERGRYASGQYPEPHNYGPRSVYEQPYTEEQRREIHAWQEARQDPLHYAVWLVDQHVGWLEPSLRAAWSRARETVLDPGDAASLRAAAMEWDGGSDAPATSANASDPLGPLASRLTGGRMRVGAPRSSHCSTRGRATRPRR
jgi:hypothetical protein